jgi:hydroxymethylpyrimidine pyrophosphatase-like HAD family hydrolase
MMIMVDVDGTLTSEQRGRSFYKCPIRQDVVDKVKKLASEGHEIVIWTGNTKYAKDVAEKLGIPAVACIRKPDLMIDNQVHKMKRRFKRNIITPEEFLVKNFTEGAE